MKIEEIRRNMEEMCIVSKEDIDEICRLESEYEEECREIAEACVEEGYPSHGSNYDLRCDQVRDYYDGAIGDILSKYEN